MQGRSGWCGWITTFRKSTGWHFATSMTPAPTRQRAVFFPGFVTDQAAAKPEFSLHRPLHLLADLDQRVPFLLRAARRGRTAANFAAIHPAGANAAENHHRVNQFTGNSIGLRCSSATSNNLLFQETQTKLSGRHTFRYGVEFLRQLATQRPSARYLGELNYTNTPGRLLRFRQLPGRFQRTFRARAERFWRDSFPSRSVPPDLLFPGYVAAGAFAQPDTGTPL